MNPDGRIRADDWENTVDAEPIALRIPDAVRVSGLGRTTLYSLIAERLLPVCKVRGRTLILRADLEQYLRGQREVA